MVHFQAALWASGEHERAAVCLQSMEGWAGSNIEPLLMPASKAWQPQDFLPDPSAEDFIDRIQAFRDECKDLPVEYLVVLVGDMVTEEALPSYMGMLNRMDGCKDATGVRHACKIA